ncbi:unnamed protein product, partial [Mesorhabditis spiculigera]
MSARKQSNLLSFFQRNGPPKEETSPKPSPKVKKEETKKPLRAAGDTASPRVSRPLKRSQPAADDSDEEQLSQPKTRRRVIVSSDDEDYLPEPKASSETDGENKTPPEPTSTPRHKNKPSFLAVSPKTPQTPRSHLEAKKSTTTPGRAALSTQLAGSFINSFRKSEDDEMDASMCTLDRTIYQMDDDKPKSSKKRADVDDLDIDGDMAYEHETFEFLKPEKIRDANRRRPDDPEYDPSTLWIPNDFLEKQTPGHTQWWKLKTQNYDTILFFKVGKFYELYHMDAVISAQHLSLSFMRGKYAHTGFPEIAFGRFADQLVSRGYKLEERQEQSKKGKGPKDKKDKVVRRELCRVTTCGTRTYGMIETPDGGVTGEPTSKHLIAIKQITADNVSTFGICLVDTTVGRFTLAHFVDDEYYSRLRTLLASFQPVQVLLERGGTSQSMKNLIDSMLSSVPCEQLSPKSQFLSGEATVKMLCDTNYLGPDSSNWPKVLNEYLDQNSAVARPAQRFEAVWTALGGVLWFLKRCLIDVDMVTMRHFEEYDPELEPHKATGLTGDAKWKGRNMVLDGVTLENLNLIPVEAKIAGKRDTVTASYSLYNVVNYCATPFGRRLLRQWICKPTCDPETLTSRQDAIEWLTNDGQAFMDKVDEPLKRIPDLARLLQKIHTLGLKYRAETHPDSRAVMFESTKYNRRKIKDLLVTLRGFEATRRIVEGYDKFVMDGESATLIDQLIGGDHIPDITPDLKHFQASFNQEQAEKDGIIVPKPGMDKEYDEALDAVEKASQDLEEYKKKIGKKYGCKAAYCGTGRNRFQLELPDSLKMSDDFDLAGRRKGYARYYTPDLRELIEQLGSAEATRDNLRADKTRRVFADFDTRAEMWDSVVQRIAQLDVLFSLAKFCKGCSLDMCRPQFDFHAGQPYIIVEKGVHPCLASKGIVSAVSKSSCPTSTYIPNDTKLGGDVAACMLLTGPNMGGKSTLMRQTAVLAVLAHMGCLVPADECRLTPIDRIFTRIGANDRIMAGQSTFFVELHETRLVLRDATADSLVLIDELGRGTSTHDGTAIASAVLARLADGLKCRTLFSTHYHSICSRFAEAPGVAFAHMACMVEGENEQDPTLETVTFLYRLVSGICPKSYGFYAAKLAGINDEVVRNAYSASQRLASCTDGLSQLGTLKSLAREGNMEMLALMVDAL